MLHAIAAEIERRREEFLAAEIADTGKLVSMVSTLDIPRAAANFRDTDVAHVGFGVPTFSNIVRSPR
jgi:aminomuconate-semialdehyde/2-hydroxymuconate-6-semialdehyde dehydrogenase